MGTPDLIIAKSSVVRLDENGPLARTPLHPNRPRSVEFMERFESKILYYDCFRSAKDSSVFLIGPPPLNLEDHLNDCTFSDGHTNQKFDATHSISRSTLLTQVKKVPLEARILKLEFAAETFQIEIQPSLSDALSGSNILFSMNKDNELQWIQDWAMWHSKTQNVDSVVLFDNGSTQYDLAAVGDTLKDVTSLKKVVLFDWPSKFGARDDRVLSYHYWSHFLQISSMNLVLRRCAAQANGLANLDIDELASPLGSGDVFDAARSTPHGIAALAGTWMSAASHSKQDTRRHADFIHVARGPAANLCPKKWVLNPQASWVDKVDVFPYWHRIMGAPDRKVTDKPVARFWHFKGISTNWKNVRTKNSAPSILHAQVSDFMEASRQVWPSIEHEYQDDT